MKERLISFFKRRWILLSLAVALVACSMVDWLSIHRLAYPPVRSFLTSEEETRTGLRQGDFYHQRTWKIRASGNDETLTERSLHWPMLGTWPTRDLQVRSIAGSHQQDQLFTFPVWIPLIVVLVWIAIRELRWRWKHATIAAP